MGRLIQDRHHIINKRLLVLELIFAHGTMYIVDIIDSAEWLMKNYGKLMVCNLLFTVFFLSHTKTCTHNNEH